MMLLLLLLLLLFLLLSSPVSTGTSEAPLTDSELPGGVVGGLSELGEAKAPEDGRLSSPGLRVVGGEGESLGEEKSRLCPLSAAQQVLNPSLVENVAQRPRPRRLLLFPRPLLDAWKGREKNRRLLLLLAAPFPAVDRDPAEGGGSSGNG